MDASQKRKDQLRLIVLRTIGLVLKRQMIIPVETGSFSQEEILQEIEATIQGFFEEAAFLENLLKKPEKTQEERKKETEAFINLLRENAEEDVRKGMAILEAKRQERISKNSL